MNKNKWFEEIFLKSLFDQTGTNKDKWLTAKQTAICVQYMERKTAHIENATGHYKHDNYYYHWNDREISLSYSKLNGCSTINFSLTPSEIAEENKKYKAEKIEAMKERAKNRYSRHPERHLNYIKKLETKINSYLEEIEECKAENDLNGLENLINYVTELQNELTIQKGAIL